ncbi:uncharacterized protein METZ01_LOCUS143789, partial [marine metagenome]
VAAGTCAGFLADNRWICYLQPGHHEANFQQTAFAQIILNCIT